MLRLAPRSGRDRSMGRQAGTGSPYGSRARRGRSGRNRPRRTTRRLRPWPGRRRRTGRSPGDRPPHGGSAPRTLAASVLAALPAGRPGRGPRRSRWRYRRQDRRRTRSPRPRRPGRSRAARRPPLGRWTHGTAIATMPAATSRARASSRTSATQVSPRTVAAATTCRTVRPVAPAIRTHPMVVDIALHSSLQKRSERAYAVLHTAVSFTMTWHAAPAAALPVAMREELAFMNPACLATLPTAPASHNRPWLADEARRLLTVARNNPLYPHSCSCWFLGTCGGRWPFATPGAPGRRRLRHRRRSSA